MCLNKMYSKIRVSKHLFDNLPIPNFLKQGDDLSPLTFNIALEYAIRKVEGNQVELKLNGTHQLLAYTVVNLVRDNTDTMKEKQKL
jgi:hypothetical protein